MSEEIIPKPYRKPKENKKGGRSLDIVVTPEMGEDFDDTKERRQEPNTNATGRHIFRTHFLMAEHIPEGNWIKSYVPKDMHTASHDFAKRFMVYFSDKELSEDPEVREQQLAQFLLDWYAEEEEKGIDMDTLFDKTHFKFPAKIVY